VKKSSNQVENNNFNDKFYWIESEQEDFVVFLLIWPITIKIDTQNYLN
jgi:hypothetical protein